MVGRILRLACLVLFLVGALVIIGCGFAGDTGRQQCKSARANGALEGAASADQVEDREPEIPMSPKARAMFAEFDRAAEQRNQEFDAEKSPADKLFEQVEEDLPEVSDSIDEVIERVEDAVPAPQPKSVPARGEDSYTEKLNRYLKHKQSEDMLHRKVLPEGAPNLPPDFRT